LQRTQRNGSDYRMQAERYIDQRGAVQITQLSTGATKLTLPVLLRVLQDFSRPPSYVIFMEDIQTAAYPAAVPLIKSVGR